MDPSSLLRRGQFVTTVADAVHAHRGILSTPTYHPRRHISFSDVQASYGLHFERGGKPRRFSSSLSRLTVNRDAIPDRKTEQRAAGGVGSESVVGGVDCTRLGGWAVTGAL